MVETMASRFNIECDTLIIGNCFMINKDEKLYFVTAAHLFRTTDKSGDLVPIRILIQNQLQSFKANVYFHTDRNVYIALIKLPEKVSQNIKFSEQVSHGNGISLD